MMNEDKEKSWMMEATLVPICKGRPGDGHGGVETVPIRNEKMKVLF
jgi:hypothetical protein